MLAVIIMTRLRVHLTNTAVSKAGVEENLIHEGKKRLISTGNFSELVSIVHFNLGVIMKNKMKYRKNKVKYLRT